MKLKDMTIEELETLSYADLAYLILKENSKSMNTPSVFKEICKLLGISDEEYSAKIGDFYTSLTTDKRFVLLDNAEWDLRDNHSIKIVMDDEDDEDDEEEVLDEDEESEDIEDSSEELEEDIDTQVDDDDIVDDDDDLDDLAIVDEDEELGEN